MRSQTELRLLDVVDNVSEMHTLLKDCEYTFNMLKNQKINGGRHKDTYALVSAIETFYRERG